MKFTACFPERRFPKSRAAGAFTLIELLTACAVLSIITIVLVSIVGQGSKLWSMTESQNQYRQRARALLEFAASELRQAVVPIDGAGNSLQLIVNPPGVTQFAYHDSVFWQAPIATDTTRSDLAEVGYFVRWTGSRANLCRFLVDPGDANYLIHSTPNEWIGDGLLDLVAPADAANNYKGLFLENVLGLWVKFYWADGQTEYTPADSRAHDGRLPAFARLSLALVDNATAGRLSAADAATAQTVGREAGSPEAFCADARLPAFLRENCSTISTVVRFDNYR